MNGMQKRICALTCCAAMTLSMASERWLREQLQI